MLSQISFLRFHFKKNWNRRLKETLFSARKKETVLHSFSYFFLAVLDVHFKRTHESSVYLKNLSDNNDFPFFFFIFWDILILPKLYFLRVSHKKEHSFLCLNQRLRIFIRLLPSRYSKATETDLLNMVQYHQFNV